MSEEVYEVRVWLGDSDPASRVYSIDHRFETFPGADMLVDLKREGFATFAALYPEAGEPEHCVVRVARVSAAERKDLASIAEGARTP